MNSFRVVICCSKEFASVANHEADTVPVFANSRNPLNLKDIFQEMVWGQLFHKPRCKGIRQLRGRDQIIHLPNSQRRSMPMGALAG